MPAPKKETVAKTPEPSAEDQAAVNEELQKRLAAAEEQIKAKDDELKATAEENEQLRSEIAGPPPNEPAKNYFYVALEEGYYGMERQHAGDIIVTDAPFTKETLPSWMRNATEREKEAYFLARTEEPAAPDGVGVGPKLRTTDEVRRQMSEQDSA